MQGQWEGSNLYVSGLARSVTEARLLTLFSHYGPVKSKHQTNYGFVQFKNAEDAECAKEELSGAQLEGKHILINYGKFVEEKEQLQAPIEPEQTIVIVLPQDYRMRAIIDHVARLVAQEGFVFEETLRYQGQQYQELNFMTPCFQTAALYNYYKWKVYSLAQGETDNYWREQRFQMTVGGPFWMPPQHPLTKGRIQEREQLKTQQNQAKQGGAQLLPLEQEEWLGLLHSLTLRRLDICKAMIFAIEHSESAIALVSSITYQIKEGIDDSFLYFMSRLYLLSDLLRNSSAHSVPGAWAFRNAIQNDLPQICQFLNLKLKDTSGLLTAKQAQAKIESIFSLWREWGVFGKEYCEGIESLLTRNSSNTLYTILSDSTPESEEQKNLVDALGVQVKAYYDKIVTSAAKNKQKLITQAKLRGVPHNRATEEIIQLLIYVEYRALEKEYKSKEEFKKSIEASKILIPENEAELESLMEQEKKIEEELLKLRDQFALLQQISAQIDEVNVEGAPLSSRDVKILDLQDIVVLDRETSYDEEERESEDIDGISLTSEQIRRIQQMGLPADQEYLLLKPVESLSESIESKLALLDELPDFI